MHRLVCARKYSSRTQFRGKLSTALSRVVEYDKASNCSVSDEDPAKPCEDGQLHRCFTAIRLLDNDQAVDAPLDTYSLAFEKCINQKNLALGLKLHSLLANHGHEFNSFLGTYLIRLFAACGTLHQADQAFCKLHEPTAFAWGAIILAHSKHGLGENAIKLYESFLSYNLQPDGHIYVAALQACANAAALTYGKRIHCQIIDSGLHAHSFVVNGIINMYLKCQSFYDASNVFDTALSRDAVTWNVMMEGCNQHGWFYKTLLLFNQMQAEGFLLDNVTFVSVLQASSCVESLQQGKMIHVLTLVCRVEKDMFIVSTMIHMYCKCGRLDDALEVFYARREVRDVVIWRAMLTGCAACGHFTESYKLFCQMQQQEGLEIGICTYISILTACSNAAALHYGQLIHTYVVESGLKVDRDLGQALIGLYTNCGKPEIASKVFNGLQCRDVVTWTAIMSGYADQGHCSNVLKLLCQMYNEGIKADEVAFSTVLKAASIQGSNLDLVRVVYTFIQVDSLESDFYVRSLLVELYARFEMFEDAHWIVYNSIKDFFCTQERFIESAQSKLPNILLEVSLLHLCSTLEDLEGAQLVHFLLIDCNFKWTAETVGYLINIYASCGMLDDACNVFDTSRSHPITVWSSMIAGYIHHGRSDDALQLFCRMQEQGFQLDERVCLSISKAFFTSACLMFGRMLHTRIGTCKGVSDRVLSIALIEMYARCGSLGDAQRVFDKLLVRDTMTWNALIAGYASSGYIREGFELFQAMQEVGCKPDATTCFGLLKACSSASLLYAGKLINHFVYENGHDCSLSLGNSLTNMYVKCGSLDDAESLLNWLSYQSKATWSLVISGLAENGNLERALLTFWKMQRAGLTPDNVTIVSALKACSSTGNLINGMLLHSFLLLGKLKFSIYLANTLITMYSKCGSLEDAMKMFHCLHYKDTGTWNALIAGCAHNNNYELTWHYFKGMQNEDVRPDAMTFLCILSFCSHMGNVKDGLHQLHCMIQQHGIIPTAEHYNCVIDLLGRTGSLLKAEDLLCSLPFLHNYVGWMSLLGHCKLHESTDVGGRCINNIVKEENQIASAFTLMERVFFHSGHLTEAGDVQGLRKDVNAWKLPGIAHIEVNNSLFSFSVQRGENFPSNNTDEKVVRLKLQMKDQGYFPCF